jgi:hypothetical protein
MRHPSEQLAARRQGAVVNPDAEFGQRALAHTVSRALQLFSLQLGVGRRALNACHAQAFSVGGLSVENANGKRRSD